MSQPYGLMSPTPHPDAYTYRSLLGDIRDK